MKDKAFAFFYLAVLPAVLAAALLSGCERSGGATSQPTQPVPTVQVVQPRRSDITRSITLPGNVMPYQQAVLYAKVAGYLKTINVDKGDRVKKGDLLAEIEVPEMLSDLVKYKAEVKVAQIEYRRVSEAQQKAPDLVMPQTVDNAKGKYDIAKANLERIETLLRFAGITAPFSGVITKRMVDPGAFIPAATSGSAAQNAALLTLMDFSRVRVQVAVPEPEVPLVATGLPVSIAMGELAGRSFEGSITRFSYALDDSTKTMLAEAEIPNPEGKLRPGMFASVKLGLERKSNALLVPAEALVVEKSKTSVFTVVENRAKKVPVKIGFDDGVSVEILEGLSGHEPVILIGKESVADGQPVNVAEGK